MRRWSWLEFGGDCRRLSTLGVELAQLVTIVVVFPAIWLLSRTSVSPAVRVAGASFALLLATAWTAERLGVGSHPLAFIEEFVIDHLGLIAVALVGAALLAAIRQAVQPTGAYRANPSSA